MKNTFMALTLAALSFTATAQQPGFAAPDGQTWSAGGFNGPAPTLSTVARAVTLPDDAWVVLEGHIVKQTGHELYEFRDSSGTVNVDIDDKDWRGQRATPSAKVRIEGEVDREWNHTEIDVKNIRVMN